MPAYWTRSQRPAAAAELATLKAQAGEVAALGCALVLWLPLAVGGYLLGRSIAGPIELAAGVLLGLAAGAISPLAYWRWRARWRRRERQDVEASVVEVLTVRGARAIAIPGRHSSTEPAFAFELEGGHTLLLMGEWLWEPETYGGDRESIGPEDDRDDIANALPPPCSFPSSDFVVHRFPASGLVLRIDILEDYVAPTPLAGGRNLEPFNESPSYCLACELDDLLPTLTAYRNE